MKNRIQEEILEYINSNSLISTHELRQHACVFKREWLPELNDNMYFYFRYINERILRGSYEVKEEPSRHRIRFNHSCIKRSNN